MTDIILTTSWDDGAPQDMRLAESLARHAIPATFYVPLENSEGRPVLDSWALRQLSTAGFEIGGHGIDHRRLAGLTPETLNRQIVDGKAMLEQRLGTAVSGFCYPGGRGVRQAAPVVAAAGFSHARTTAMGHLDVGKDRLRRPTTLQMFPHGPLPLLRNWARNGGRAPLALTCRLAALNDPLARLDLLLAEVSRRGGTLHLWGHSWEIDELGMWNMLDRMLTRLAEAIPQALRRTNGQVPG